jgi:hypothetical protein
MSQDRDRLWDVVDHLEDQHGGRGVKSKRILCMVVTDIGVEG